MVRKAVMAGLLAVTILTAGLAGAQGPAAWPEFRGPYGNGLVSAPGDATPVGLPLTWSETDHVRWKTAIPLKGWSTPAVLDGQVWLTTATEEGTDFYAICVDAESGAVLFNERIFHCDTPEPLGNGVNCYASPSPVVEPGRAYVHFGSYGTACLDTATFKIRWSRTDLPCRHYRGPGSSPILAGNLLVLTFDGADQQYVAALDKNSGATVWRTDRTTAWNDLDENGQPKREGDLRKSFSTPLLIEANGTQQLLSIGSMAAFAYDPATGRELWSVWLGGYTGAPRPVYADGVAYLSNGRGEPLFAAYRVDGTGDVTNTHLVWKMTGPLLPQEPSPTLADGLVYLLSNNGAVTCVDASTGEQVWSDRIGGNFVSSPIYGDGRLYLSSTQGKTAVLKAGRTFEQLAENRLDEGFMASPAVAGKALFLRTKTHLYRIEE
ncbi:MAG: PQQ-binding-like beta-propeller repeat protein [Candidatus Hydrogenedentes bacterium]|nr:PQQ-binding-like beta-propeller repeat protein [Candidatus Hydrogenedentota bacterium]